MSVNTWDDKGRMMKTPIAMCQFLSIVNSNSVMLLRTGHLWRANPHIIKYSTLHTFTTELAWLLPCWSCSALFATAPVEDSVRNSDAHLRNVVDNAVVFRCYRDPTTATQNNHSGCPVHEADTKGCSPSNGFECELI